MLNTAFFLGIFNISFRPIYRVWYPALGIKLPGHSQRIVHKVINSHYRFYSPLYRAPSGPRASVVFVSVLLFTLAGSQ